MTIEKEHMIDPILILCPSFVPIYQKFLTDWENDEETERDGLPYYIALGDLARHLIKLLKADDTRSFSKIFEVVEQWHVNGSHYVQEAAVIGLLEGLQNIASHDSKIDAEDFFVWLGPVSKSYWEKLNRFWNGEVGALNED